MVPGSSHRETRWFSWEELMETMATAHTQAAVVVTSVGRLNVNARTLSGSPGVVFYGLTGQRMETSHMWLPALRMAMVDIPIFCVVVGFV
jgi:hypothetical protein